MTPNKVAFDACGRWRVMQFHADFNDRLQSGLQEEPLPHSVIVSLHLGQQQAMVVIADVIGVDLPVFLAFESQYVCHCKSWISVAGFL